jgi:hypothetical protein
MPDQPRLSFARPRQLKRATQVDWPSLISVMRGAAERGEQPFAATVELSRSLFSAQRVALGVEHSLATGPKPCGLWVDAERARFVRRPIVEILNSGGVRAAREAVEASLGSCFSRENDRWQPALRLPENARPFQDRGICRLDEPKIYGREVAIATATADEAVFSVKWLRRVREKWLQGRPLRPVTAKCLVWAMEAESPKSFCVARPFRRGSTSPRSGSVPCAIR